MSKAKISQKCVKDFIGYDFESCDVPSDCYGDRPHLNFFNKYYVPIVRSEIKKMAKELKADVVFSHNYFDWNANFSRDGVHVYVSASDHRYFPDWYKHILYRYTESVDGSYGNRDGMNLYCSYEELKDSIDECFDTYSVPRF